MSGGITDFVTVLTTRERYGLFMSDGVGRIGASVGVAVGTGRTAQTGADINAKRSRGRSGCYLRALPWAFAGISLELGGIRTRHKVNRNFYGRVIHPTEILTGQEPPPVAAAPLYEEYKQAARALFKAAKWGGGRVAQNTMVQLCQYRIARRQRRQGPICRDRRHEAPQQRGRPGFQQGPRPQDSNTIHM